MPVRSFGGRSTGPLLDLTMAVSNEEAHGPSLGRLIEVLSRNEHGH